MAARPPVLSVGWDGEGSARRKAGLCCDVEPHPPGKRRNGGNRRRSRIEMVWQNGGPGGHAERRRRTAPLRLECLQLLFVPIFVAPPHGAPVPSSSGSAVVPH